MNKLDEAIEREVRPWLDLVDSLRAQGIQDELSLPQVRHGDMQRSFVNGDTLLQRTGSNCCRTSEARMTNGYVTRLDLTECTGSFALFVEVPCEGPLMLCASNTESDENKNDLKSTLTWSE